MEKQQRCVTERDREVGAGQWVGAEAAALVSHLCCFSSCFILPSAPGFLWALCTVVDGGYHIFPRLTRFTSKVL